METGAPAARGNSAAALVAAGTSASEAISAAAAKAKQEKEAEAVRIEALRQQVAASLAAMELGHDRAAIEAELQAMSARGVQNPLVVTTMRGVWFPSPGVLGLTKGTQLVFTANGHKAKPVKAVALSGKLAGSFWFPVPFFREDVVGLLGVEWSIKGRRDFPAQLRRSEYGWAYSRQYGEEYVQAWFPKSE